MFSSERKMSYIKKTVERYGLDVSVCLGIYSIETKYRKFFFRVCEDVWFVKDFILNKLFKRKIRNLTVGVFQIGLTSILKYNGYDIWQYYDYLSNITFKQFFCILRAMSFKNNVEIFCKKVSEYGTSGEDINLLIARYGELYNGNVNYILMLNSEYNRLQKYTNFELSV